MTDTDDDSLHQPTDHAPCVAGCIRCDYMGEVCEHCGEPWPCLAERNDRGMAPMASKVPLTELADDLDELEDDE